MSITINLMNNQSDINVVSKTLTTLSSVTGVLRDETSILKPTVLIEGTIPTNCNYFQIPDLARYYYITDITSVRNNLFRISGRVDVLQSYSTQIRECEAIIARQQSDWNLYVDDGAFKVYQNKNFLLKQFPSGFSTQEFVLAVAGG